MQPRVNTSGMKQPYCDKAPSQKDKKLNYHTNLQDVFLTYEM